MGYLRRTSSLAVLHRSRPDRAARLRLLAQLPWFGRNVAVKIVLRVGRLVGYHRPDPY